jgi:hypothetical protein
MTPATLPDRYPIGKRIGETLRPQQVTEGWHVLPKHGHVGFLKAYVAIFIRRFAGARGHSRIRPAQPCLAGVCAAPPYLYSEDLRGLLGLRGFPIRLTRAIYIVFRWTVA